MIRTLVRKERRELLPLSAVALLVQLYLFTTAIGMWRYPIAQGTQTIPFIRDSLLNYMLFVAGAAAIAIGLWQTMLESSRGTFQFLLHRPLPRTAILGVKLACGAAVCLIVGGLPVLFYALWAATPGTHASPFFWSMTTSAAMTVLFSLLLYLSAFLSGLRPGRWYGSRFLPAALGLFATVLLAVLAGELPSRWPLLLLVAVVIDACLILVVQYVAQMRDFS